jgi:hydroxyacylglutathione hydrolase
VPQSTLGFERIANWAFAIEDEEGFVREVLAGQPEAPRYFAEMKRVNRDGPPPLARLPQPERLPHERAAERTAGDALVVDVRPTDAFAAAHLPGSIGIPLGGGFVTWAGSLLPYDRPIHLLVASAADVEPALRGLRSIGLDRVVGILGEAAVRARAASGRPVGTLQQVAPAELAGLGGALVVDVRSAAEWDDGHLPGAMHLPLGRVPDIARDLPRDRTVVTCCQSGARSAIAASVLAAAGLPDVLNLRGGVDACRAAGLTLATDEAVAPATAA